MATLSHKEARTFRASKHAKYTWLCPLCGKTCHGNGGKSSHQAKHLKEAKLPKGDWSYLVHITSRELP